MTLQTSLVGTILVAMPTLKEELAKTVILICGHDENGAVGLIINKKIPSLYLDDLLEQLNIPTSENFPEKIPLYTGGETDMGRGFVLHSPDYKHEQTIAINNEISLTATLDILNRIGENQGPKSTLLALGYTNWDNGQLEQELKDNKWLWTTCSKALIFNDDDDKWEDLVKKMGSGKGSISLETGTC
ncbi:MAG: YqgE/AlgH family protein [Candidatus Paracaedibacteraceae bacterium]|nr:YqgE/AlgH family protein [Candidatus Paracaedibacteraceae bacterium]